jgi:hypothetical protein
MLDQLAHTCKNCSLVSIGGEEEEEAAAAACDRGLLLILFWQVTKQALRSKLTDPTQLGMISSFSNREETKEKER